LTVLARFIIRLGSTVFILVIAAYLAVAGLMFFGQRSILYHPNDLVPQPVDFGVPEMTAHRLETADGFRPLAWWIPGREKASPVIVWFHGNGGHIGQRAARARFFIDAGYGVLLAGYRYNARAGGDPSEEGLLADGRAAVEFVRSQGVRTDRIILYGESLGTGIATAMAAEYKAGGLVLEMPYSSITDMARERYWYLPVRLLLLDTFDSESRMAKVRSPVLVIHGENDRVIPVAFGRKLFAAAPEPKEGHFIPGGTHGNLYRLGAGNLVLGFLDRRVARGPDWAR
jgi:fermentation-respiration switch protein FrsA (DUF1100 family)